MKRETSQRRAFLRLTLLGLLLLLATVATAAAEVVNLNKADAETLQQHLTGIGPVKSQAIVDYRKKHGPFKSLDDLQNVKGVGPTLIEKNRKNLSLTSGATRGEQVKRAASKRDDKKSVASQPSGREREEDVRSEQKRVDNAARKKSEDLGASAKGARQTTETTKTTAKSETKTTKEGEAGKEKSKASGKVTEKEKAKKSEKKKTKTSKKEKKSKKSKKAKKKAATESEK